MVTSAAEGILAARPTDGVDVGMVVRAVDDEHRDVDVGEARASERERVALRPHLERRHRERLSVVRRVGVDVASVRPPHGIGDRRGVVGAERRRDESARLSALRRLVPDPTEHHRGEPLTMVAEERHADEGTHRVAEQVRLGDPELVHDLEHVFSHGGVAVVALDGAAPLRPCPRESSSTSRRIGASTSTHPRSSQFRREFAPQPCTRTSGRPSPTTS